MAITKEFCFCVQSLELELLEAHEATKRVVAEQQGRMFEIEYNIRQEVSKEFQAQLTRIEEEHEYVSIGTGQ